MAGRIEEERDVNGGEERDVNGEQERGHGRGGAGRERRGGTGRARQGGTSRERREERAMDVGEERGMNERGGTGMIVVTGASGNAGSEVVRGLISRGERVRAFVRDPGRARQVLGEGAELAVGDFADPASVRAALEGADALLLSCADDPRRVGWETAAIDAAVAAGVRRIVKLSAATAEPGSPVAFWDWHGRVEQHLRASGADWVILRAGWYMSNLLAAAPRVAAEGRLYAPAGEARIAMIDPRDVGAAAAAVLSSPGHEGQTYLLTGPRAITYTEVAAALSAATGSRVEFVDVPDDAAYQGMIHDGMPGFVAEQIVAMFGRLREGVAAQVSPAVEGLTGRAPRDFGSFARDHASLPGQPAGLDGAEYVVATMHGAHPDLRFTIDDLIAEGDRVTIRWTLHGTNTGPMLGRPPTGKPVELAAIVIFRIADGKIAERWAGWKPGRAPIP